MSAPQAEVTIIAATSFHSNNDPLCLSRLTVVSDLCKAALACESKPAVLLSVEENSDSFYGDDADRSYFLQTDGVLKLSQAQEVENLTVSTQLKHWVSTTVPHTPVFVGKDVNALKGALAEHGVSVVVWTGAFADHQPFDADYRVHIFTAGVHEGVNGRAIRQSDRLVLCVPNQDPKTQEEAAKKKEHVLSFEPKNELLELDLSPENAAPVVEALQPLVRAAVKAHFSRSE